MKILMISDVYFPRVNGVSTSINTFRQYLRQLGHEVHLVCPAYHDGPHDNDDAHIYRIPSVKVPMDPEDRLMRTKYITRMLAKFRAENVDVVHIQTPFLAHRVGVKIANALGVPKVETYHTYFEEYFYHYIKFLPSSLLKRAARSLTMRQSNQLDAMIVPSNAMLTVLRNYGVDTPIEIIPTGLDMNKFQSGDGRRFRDQHGIPQHRPTLVHVGRVAFEKNIDFLLHVLNEIKKDMPDILMIIAGEGPAKPHLQQLVNRLNLQNQVMFVGYLSRADALLDCYKAGDVFVFSSRTETQGLVLLEAMALGVPVVSIAAMGTVDILSSQQGCIVAHEYVDDFSKKILSILTSPILRAELSLEAKKYAATWSNNTMTQRLIDFYSRSVSAVELSRNATPVYVTEKSN